MNRLHLKLSSFLLLVFSGMSAQDGPRSTLLIPKGVVGLNARWMGMKQNLDATGSILIPGSQTNINVYPITAYATFSLFGQFAQLSAMGGPGDVSAKATDFRFQFVPIEKLKLNASGWQDGYVQFKVGILGAPAMDVKSYITRKMKFSLFADMRYWYSGTYNHDEILNVGTNRSYYQLGLPMAIPLNNKLAKATWLEIHPAVILYEPNTSPAIGSGAKEKIQQEALYSVETHVSHNFSKKLWGFTNAMYRYGGEVSKDGGSDNGTLQNILYTGLGVGYQFVPYLGAYVDYNTIVAGGKTEASSNMFRVAVSFSFVNTKNLKK